MNAITYSLLVPAYNAERYIDGFLNNVLSLSFKFDEMLFYDDASTDNTYQILKSKGLNVIHGKLNKGPGFARNRLAESAKSNYIHFHDIDDEFTSSFLSLVDKELQDEMVDVVIGYADWIDPVTRVPSIEFRYDKCELQKNPLNYFIANPLGIINTIYQKKVFLQVYGFNEEIKCWEDADLHIRLAAFGASFSVINQVIAFSLRYNTGLSKNQAKCWLCRLKFVNKYLTDYNETVPKSIFTKEVSKIQNALIGMGAFNELKYVMDTDAKNCLYVVTKKTKIIYWFSKIIPFNLLTCILKIIRSL